MLRPPFSQELIPINDWDVIVIGAGAAGLMTSLELPKNNSQLGFSYNHISNASLGDKNPGANSYSFNFLQQF